jgi:hypothetical protein
MPATFRALYIVATLHLSLPRRRTRYVRISPLRRRTRKLHAAALPFAPYL